MEESFFSPVGRGTPYIFFSRMHWLARFFTPPMEQDEMWLFSTRLKRIKWSRATKFYEKKKNCRLSRRHETGSNCYSDKSYNYNKLKLINKLILLVFPRNQLFASRPQIVVLPVAPVWKKVTLCLYLRSYLSKAKVINIKYVSTPAHLLTSNYP